MPGGEFIKQLIGGPSDFGLGWAIILASSVLAIMATFITLIKWLISKMGTKSQLLHKISLLTIGTDIDYFKTFLGNPAFINRVGNYTELIFVNRYFYVQALESFGRVVLFSITTRERGFKPVFKIGGSDVTIKLGKTKFSELGEPRRVFKRCGDHGGFDFYAELHWFGNPGHYLYYGFGINENGHGRFLHVPHSFMENVPEDKNEIDEFRAGNSINTYTVVGSIEEDEIVRENIEFGPQRSQIRVLNE